MKTKVSKAHRGAGSLKASSGRDMGKVPGIPTSKTGKGGRQASTVNKRK